MVKATTVTVAVEPFENVKRMYKMLHLRVKNKD